MDVNVLLSASERAYMKSLGFEPEGVSASGRTVFFILRNINEELFSFLVLKYSSKKVWVR